MRYLTIAIVSIVLLLAGTPAYAFNLDFDGHASVGIGAGFGDEDTGPGVLSAKYWDTWLEIGGELYYDGDEEDHIDTLGLLWLLYRHDLHREENNTPWVGAGIGELVSHDSFQNGFGFMAAMGWEGRSWGMEFKYGYFDPSLYSFVVYYHF